MITLIYGDDITASRNYYISQKQHTAEAVTINGSQLTVNEITQVLQGSGLFGEKPTIFIEEFFSKNKTSKEANAIIEKLLQNISETDIYLWESKPLTAAQTNKLPKAIKKEFKITKTIFQFLDSLKPNNTTNMIKLFHQTIETDEEQFILTMLIRHIRILLALTDQPAKNNIEEVKRIAQWQQTKLIKQSQFFTKEKLKETYTQLYEIEKGFKTGTLSITIIQSIDILLTTI